jgi:hypothetical protein
LTIALAFFGLFMAVVELYIPTLSMSLEHYISSVRAKLVATGAWLKNVPDAVGSWIMGSPIGRFCSNHWLVTLVVGLLSGFISIKLISAEYEYVGGLLILLGLFPIAFFIIRNYFLNYLWIFTFILRIPVFLLDVSYRALNFIGKGKALSGVGLVLAFWGLLDPLIFPQ